MKTKKNRVKLTKKNAQNKQIVPVTGSFGFDVTNNGKQVTRVSIVVAAMHENVF